MFPSHWHRYIFLFGIIGLAAGMLFGSAATSIPQIILFTNWLLEKNISDKWNRLKNNRIFWALIFIFLLHVFGMLYTTNTYQGLNDLKIKLPLLILPLVFFSTNPLNAKELRFLFGFFFLSVLLSSFCCYFVCEGYTKKIIVDIRKASVFMSHIRFSLFIAFSVIGLVYWFFIEQKRFIKFLCATSVLWLLFFMDKLEMATGFLCLLIVGVFLILSYLFKKSHKIVASLFTSLIIVIGFFALNKAISSLNTFTELIPGQSNTILRKTKNGRLFFHDTLSPLTENGNLIAININEDELQQEWDKKSTIPFKGYDKKGNNLRYTIIRYLASKGLNKDSTGVNSLNNADINNIEMGVSNYKYPIKGGVNEKWREFVWEYTNYKLGGNPSGHTLTMRLEFWKTALYIIGKNPLFGVGTGDIQDSFNNAYKETNSKLDLIWRLRCHNQYLAITVAFGAFGLIMFLFYISYPAICLRKNLHYLYWPFFFIVLLSFLTEDTLETQAGVTFFAFFQTLFLRLGSTINSKGNS